MIKDGWQGDRICTVIVLRDKDDDGNIIKKRMLKVRVDELKYNVSPSMKISIPQRVFDAVCDDKDIGIIYLKDKNHECYREPKTGISIERWKGSDGLYWKLGFKQGQLISGEPILRNKK